MACGGQGAVSNTRVSTIQVNAYMWAERFFETALFECCHSFIINTFQVGKASM